MKILDLLNSLKSKIRLYIVPSFFKSEAENYVDNLYLMCKRRDRSQSFDEWINSSIELMAIDEVQSGKLHQETAEKVKEEWGTSWELFYPQERINFEKISKQDYFSALKKFDDKVEEESK